MRRPERGTGRAAKPMPCHPRVLFASTKPGSAANPFLRLLEQSLSSYVSVEFFSWRRALTGKYDVLHVHWPESLVRTSGVFRSVAKLAACALLFIRVWLLQIPVVRTVHNVDPHERGRGLERAALRILHSLETVRIYLNESSENDYSRGVVILHGTYPRPASNVATQSRIAARLLFFGQIRAYKGLDELLAAFTEYVRQEPRSGTVLRLVGEPVDKNYAESARTRHNGSRVEFVLHRTSDEALDDELAKCEGVILPYLKFYNSGAAILALSRNRPVLVPKSPSSESLRDEAGSEWVSTFEPPIDSADIQRFMAAIRERRTAAPALRNRSWNEIGTAHLAAYEEALKASRSRAPRRLWMRIALDSLKHRAEVVRMSTYNAPK